MWRHALLALLFIASQRVMPSAADTDTAPGQLKKNLPLQGKLAYVTLHDQREQWAITDDAGFLTPLNKKAFMAPKVDKDGKEFQPGTKLGLTCDIDADGVCSPSEGSSIEVLDTAQMLVAYAPAIQQKLLVLIMDYSECGYAPGLNESAVRSIFLGPNGDGTGGVAQKYSQCSYGRFRLNATAFRTITVPQNCSTTVTASCSWWAISNGADTAARALLGATAFASFTHYAYILPPGLASRCNWAGLALLPGNQIWLQTSSYGVYRWATVLQESLHNYGLWHSWRNGVEYEDYSTAMGRGDACPNAAETSRMGWSIPAAGGDAISSTVLSTAGVPRGFVLPASYKTGNGNYLRVVPDWLTTYYTSATGKNLYIDVRVAKLGDAALGTTYASRVHVHEVNATMDNAYPASYQNADRNIQIISLITPLSRVNLTAYNLVVYTGSWIPTDNMQVYLCRFASSPSECGSMTGSP